MDAESVDRGMKDETDLDQELKGVPPIFNRSRKSRAETGGGGIHQGKKTPPRENQVKQRRNFLIKDRERGNKGRAREGGEAKFITALRPLVKTKADSAQAKGEKKEVTRGHRTRR